MLVLLIGSRKEAAVWTVEQHYRSFLLRIWQARQDGEPVWRASLEEPHTGRRIAFASLAQLHAFLQSGAADPSADEESDPVI